MFLNWHRTSLNFIDIAKEVKIQCEKDFTENIEQQLWRKYAIVKEYSNFPWNIKSFKIQTQNIEVFKIQNIDYVKCLELGPQAEIEEFASYKQKELVK